MVLLFFFFFFLFFFFFFLMIRRPPRSTPLYSSAASDVYKRQVSILVATDLVVLGACTLEGGLFTFFCHLSETKVTVPNDTSFVQHHRL